MQGLTPLSPEQTLSALDDSSLIQRSKQRWCTHFWLPSQRHGAILRRMWKTIELVAEGWLAPLRRAPKLYPPGIHREGATHGGHVSSPRALPRAGQLTHSICVSSSVPKHTQQVRSSSLSAILVAATTSTEAGAASALNAQAARQGQAARVVWCCVALSAATQSSRGAFCC